jgi:hypothetical protein
VGMIEGGNDQGREWSSSGMLEGGELREEVKGVECTSMRVDLCHKDRGMGVGDA